MNNTWKGWLVWYVAVGIIQAYIRTRRHPALTISERKRKWQEFILTTAFWPWMIGRETWEAWKQR